MQEWHTFRAHACFRLDIRFPIGDNEWLLRGERDLFDLWQSLSYRIMRNPDDLLAHTRRVRLCHEPALQRRLAGALGDLAYVLGDLGIPLQQRLSAESASVLADASELDTAMTLGNDSSLTTGGRVLPTLSQQLRQKKVDGTVSTP